ncbi:hypothetical protein PROFUN_07378 [Planoprotostelium fungivorum]|uniref:Uncharacterized protein n=1 Tax=Planoprotostelium fungivorum TaxID=1890364 RepID=A0A2P6MTF7_9EUKA|nr:hypothetical protein PROFUN_07378 [Planoprotostelium fungivorum]
MVSRVSLRLCVFCYCCRSRLNGYVYNWDNSTERTTIVFRFKLFHAFVWRDRLAAPHAIRLLGLEKLPQQCQ